MAVLCHHAGKDEVHCHPDVWGKISIFEIGGIQQGLWQVHN